MAWTDYEDAVWQAIVDASGATPSDVRWEGGNTIRPPGQFLSLSHVSMSVIGIDYEEKETDLGRPAGEEIKLTSMGPRIWTTQVSIFDQDEPLVRRPFDVAQETSLRLGSSLVRQGLIDAGIGLLSVGAVNSLPATIDNQTEMQAIFEMQMNICLSYEDYVGYINTVIMENTVSGETITVTG